MNISCLIAFVRGLLKSGVSLPLQERLLREAPGLFRIWTLVSRNRINDFAATGIRKYWKQKQWRRYAASTDAANFTRCNFVAIYIIARETAFFSSFSSNCSSTVPSGQYSKQIVILLKEWPRRLIAFLTIKLLCELAHGSIGEFAITMLGSKW